jgi:adenine-specific DNA-methyltransferase
MHYSNRGVCQACAMVSEGLIERTEQRRQHVSRSLAAKRRSELGQFFTQAAIARFLASLVDLPSEGELRLLDPGAGVGSLAAAVADRVIRAGRDVRLHVVAFELDAALVPHLHETLHDCECTGERSGVKLTTDLRNENFVEWASDALSGSNVLAPESFTACVMNPPYRKINASGGDRAALERIGVRVTNLYAGFLALAAALLEPGGQLSAITPRSFANGPYFKPFREFFLDRMALDRLHVYEERGRLFADAAVLQENVIIRATRGGQRNAVLLSTSAGCEEDPVGRTVPYEAVVQQTDPHQFVHIPVDEQDTAIAQRVADLPATLTDLNVQVSTGRVVDFRAREYLRQDPEPGAVPLIYPGHLRDAQVFWPQPGAKKPNALVACEQTAALLLPNGAYVVVKRFSAKEERRRVVASLATPDSLPGVHVAFENHLNVYHRDGRGLPLHLAIGLVAYLNSTIVDQYVRQFNGHTQINAADLRELRYPSTERLSELGEQLGGRAWPEQDELDALVDDHLVPVGDVSALAAAA